MRLRSAARAAVVLLAVLALPLDVAAQASTGELRDEPFRHLFAAELGLFYADHDDTWVVALQPAVHAQIGALEQTDSLPISVQLDVDWRGAGFDGDSPAGPSSGFRAWNPYLGARVGHEAGEPGSRWRARGGLGLTLPLANLYDAGSELFTSKVVGQALTGGWDPWLSSRPEVAVVVRGDFEYRHTHFFVGAETALGLLLPIEHEGVTGSTILVPQLGVWAAGRLVEQLALGVRFQAVAQILTRAAPGASDTEGFTALVPFLRSDLGPGFIETRVVINLDDPWGPAFDDGRFWGWYIGGGVTL